MKLTNELIAEKVMGWRVEPWKQYPSLTDQPTHICYMAPDSLSWGYTPDFLNDWNAMKLVIEKMTKEGYKICMVLQGDNKWGCFYDRNKIYKTKRGQSSVTEVVVSKYLPTAVCLAALKALGIEVELCKLRCKCKRPLPLANGQCSNCGGMICQEKR